MKKISAIERRAQIIQVSRELFSQKGFSGTTTKEIARSAGVSEAMIFRHFASKDELYTAIIQQRISEAGESVPAAALASHDDRLVFGEFARFVLEKTQEDPTAMRLLYYCALEGHSTARDYYSSYEVKQVKRLIEYIQSRITEGAFRPLDPVLVARAFMGMLCTYVTSEYLFHFAEYFPPHPTENVVETFLQLFLAGAQASPLKSAGPGV